MSRVLSSRQNDLDEVLEALIDFEGLLYRIEGGFFDQHNDVIMGSLAEIITELRRVADDVRG